jgi:hypothetical protein
MWFKLVYTAFCAVLVPAYWRDYGPANFLFFCDVALLTTLVALWLEDALLVSAAAVGILLPQFLWVVDFLANATGRPLTGMTDYMFDAKLPLFTRGLSFFHFWLPFVLLWLVWRLGYDRRAFAVWTVAAWTLLLVCYFLLPMLPVSVKNVNYVFGPGDATAQHWMPALAWLGLLLAGLPALVFYPAHRLLCRLAPPVAGGRACLGNEPVSA